MSTRMSGRDGCRRLGRAVRVSAAVAVALVTAAFPTRTASAGLMGRAVAVATASTGESPDRTGRALAVAAAATAGQALVLGTPLRPSPDVLHHRSPSLALGALLVRHGAAATPSEARAITELDNLPEPLRGSLTRVVDAFIAVENATTAAYRRADTNALQLAVEKLAAARSSVPTAIADEPGHALRQAGIDLAPVLSARLLLLDAVAALERAAAEARAGAPEASSTASSTASAAAPSTATCGHPLGSVPNVVAIDATADGKGDANCYSDDFRLVVDIGGKDTYRNNAGGNGDKAVPTWPFAAGSAALVDLGGHDDRYVSGRHYGINGGAIVGSGFLYDDGGDDVYAANATQRTSVGGTNGGSELGAGFLYDGWGNDTYSAARYAANGGTSSGAALLLDGAGHDSYVATNPSGVGDSNNGAAAGGAAGLIDLGQGTDTYSGSGNFSNGGGIVGVLLDAGGNGDTYKGTTNSGSTSATDESQVPKGAGAQLDSCRSEGGGDVDSYLSDICTTVNGAAAAVSIDDVSVVEGKSGTAAATLTVSLSKPWPVPVVVDYTTSDISATAGSDYTATSGTLLFAAMESAPKTVSVSVSGDESTEDNEVFSVVVTRAAGAMVSKGHGKATILNDDPPDVRISDVSLIEGDSGPKAFNFTVTLSVPTTSTVTLRYATADGTAMAPGDYTTTAGTASMAAGTTSATITVSVNGDVVVEANETFFVTLSGVTNANVAKAQGKGTIVNDDFEG